MGGPKRPNSNQPSTRVEHARDAMNLGGFQRLLKTKRGKDGWHALRQHGLTRSRRTYHQNVVATRASHLECALGGLLTAHILEVDSIVLRLAQQGFAIHLERQNFPVFTKRMTSSRDRTG